MPNLPSDEKLLDAVRDAGWFLEHDAVRALEAAEMHPRPGWAFEDPDEPTTSRELDVWAYRQVFADETHKVYVSVRFLVECKQSSLPFVGIGYDLPEAHFRQTPSRFRLPTEMLRETIDANGSYREIPAWPALGLRDLELEHGESNFRVTQLTRLDRSKGDWAATNTGVFTSLVYPLAKALRASQSARGAQPARNVVDAAKRVGWVDIALHFPVVLLGCPLFVVDTTNGEPTVGQRSWTTARRELKSKNVKGIFDIDVVTATAFPNYIKQRLGLAEALAEVVKTDPYKYTGESAQQV